LTNHNITSQQFAQSSTRNDDDRGGGKRASFGLEFQVSKYSKELFFLYFFFFFELSSEILKD